MKAIVQDRYGSSDTLKLEEIDPPRPAEGEVLVRVEAAGMDRGVWHLMTGLPYLVRLGFGLRAPKTRVPGLDVSGIVEAVGAKVTRFRPGDEVFGIGIGTFAEFARAQERKLTHKPAGLDFVEAAAVAISGGTALQGLRDQGGLAAGQHVLITGASGGVGTFAVQIARALGARVTGVCSGPKAERVREIGAHDVIDYRAQDFTEGETRYDLILDLAGNRSLSHLSRILTPRGTLVITGGEEGGPWLGGIDRQLRAMVRSRFTSRNLRSFIASESSEHLTDLLPWLESGEVRPIVDRVFPLAEVPAAMEHLVQGRATGKIVIRV